jgi:hypothetical protein
LIWPRLQAFEVGINVPRSRGDRNEHFGGKGATWRGAFVGGALFVRAVTRGEPGDYLHGILATYSLYPER